ncbi:MAG: Protein of unknown function (DUF3122) [Phormidesmis priestleyi Ana]|uniref:DUF3122 domain-containing protein n=1 Tax=Phormidesmis priestleyi Ana TaxID=1666911 RepID=A0A0P8DB95_9CYAN|nr:MAG: Protein of unknown function (DUF3122) [Phormidesmis priestleyi Ana]
MWQNIRQLILWFVMGGLVLLLCLMGLETRFVSPANAAIRQLEEAPGQVVYQSRQTLKDQHGSSWQAVAFKRIRSGDSSGDTEDTPTFYLRLVGFPGVANIDRSRPLVLTDSLGTSFTANDASAKIFTDTTSPEPNVGQYDIAPIVSNLSSVLPLKLSLPTVQRELTQLDSIELLVSPALVEEWKTLFSQAPAV